MVRTTLEHSPTKDRLLDAAEELMLAKGFSATTVDKICESAKLTKGSFFHYFESKEQLGKELLERFCAANQATLQATCAREADPLKRIHKMIEGMIQMAKGCDGSQACLLGTFAQELSDTNPGMRSLCAKAFSQWKEALKEDLDAAKAKYAPRATIDTASLAEHFIAVTEGAMILSKAQQSTKVIEQSFRHFRQYLDSLFLR